MYPLARSQHQANILIALSALVVSFIRIRQLATVGELSYTYFFNFYEVLVTAASFTSYAAVQELSRTKVFRP
jgi:hypothetical protein